MYQKCVCFIFIVILAVLSCSGFRIDSLTMADFDKKNFRADAHRVRHHRLWRTQTRTRYSSHIDVVAYPPRPPPAVSKLFLPRLPPRSEILSDSEKVMSLTSPTNFPNENLAQIPPTAKSVVSRPQRSPDRPRRNKWSTRQEEDIFSKAYRAKFVVLVNVESKNNNETNGLCQRYVKVIKDIKGNAKESFAIVNGFPRHMLTAKCDLVKKMMILKKYLLLLDENKRLLHPPKPKEKLKSAMRKITRVCKTGFKPKEPIIDELKEVAPKSRRKIEKKNRILFCKTKGFPVPKITWRRKGEILHPNRSYNVLYKRRHSKLIIKKPDAEYFGIYECIAESLNGYTSTRNITLMPPQPSESFSSGIPIDIPIGKECPEEVKEAYCQNGGRCFYEPSMQVPGCYCPENTSGERCEYKRPSNTSFLMDEPPR